MFQSILSRRKQDQGSAMERKDCLDDYPMIDP
jgi:hypothetical protein